MRPSLPDDIKFTGNVIGSLDLVLVDNDLREQRSVGRTFVGFQSFRYSVPYELLDLFGSRVLVHLGDDLFDYLLQIRRRLGGQGAGR